MTSASPIPPEPVMASSRFKSPYSSIKSLNTLMVAAFTSEKWRS